MSGHDMPEVTPDSTVSLQTTWRDFLLLLLRARFVPWLKAVTLMAW